MSTPSNPLVGASWGGPNGQSPMQQSPFNLAGMQGPGGNNYNVLNAGLGNPGGYSNARGPREISRNQGLENILASQMKLQLAPQFARYFGQYGKGAGDFFSMLADKGSPYYKQRQAEAFTQGTKSNQDATALTMQELASRGYGYGPSGTNAAMLGGMAMQALRIYRNSSYRTCSRMSSFSWPVLKVSRVWLRCSILPSF